MSRAARLAVIVAVVGVGVGAVAAATLRDGGEDVSVATVRQASSEPTTEPEPQAPVTMEGVAARLECPDPPDPNGPSDLVSVYSTPAPGLGSPTPEAAMRDSVMYSWPGVDPGSFVITARAPAEVRYENRHAALFVTRVEGGLWVVTSKSYCGTIAAEWQAGRR